MPWTNTSRQKLSSSRFIGLTMDFPRLESALSQQRLFNHLTQNGYFQCPNTPSFFRNQDGSIRFSLVVDDFAILWTSKKSMDHFIATLRQLYSVKINWEGTKYIGMDIDIDRNNRHVTISMPGYIDLTGPKGPKGLLHRTHIAHPMTKIRQHKLQL